MTNATNNDEQSALWNGPAGRAWVEMQDLLDAMMKPFEAPLVEAAAGGTRVLDIGCGTGSTTLAIARSLGTAAHCTGVDISAPMLALARQRAETAGSPVAFVNADAQTHAFEPAAFDRLVSRFGVMFFNVPARAFANLRGAAAPGALLSVIVWRGAAENPFMTTAERAAAPLLPELPPRRLDAPGQFAFADRAKVETILAQSGWADVALEPLDVDCAFPAHELPRYVGWMGPVGNFLQKADAATRARVLAAVLPAFEPFVHDDEVRFPAACWRVTARAAS